MIAVGSDSRAQAVKELNERHVIQAGKNRNGTQLVFRALDARGSSAVSHVLQTTHKITVSCLVRHTSNCSNGNSPLRAWKVRFRPPTLHTRWSSSDKHNTTTKRKTQQHVAQCGKNGAELSHVHTVTSTAYIQSTRAVESSFFATFHTPLGRDLTQVSVRFRTSTVGLHKYSKFTAALQLELQVLVTWLDSSGLSALMRQVRCDCLIKSLPDLSDPPIRVGPAPLSAVSIPSVLPLTSSVSVRKSTSIRPRADVSHQRRMGVCRLASAIHVLLVILSSRSCQSSWARALLSTSCHFFSCSGARRTRTVRLLDGLILARSLTSPQPPIGSYLPCIPEFGGNKTATCTVVSTSSASVARSTPMKLSASTVQQLLSPPARRDHRVCEKNDLIHVPTWLVSSIQAWFLTEMHAQCDTG